MARISFDSVFVQHSEDQSIEPRQRIRVGGVELGPGVRFTRGAAFAGVDFTLLIGREIEAETDGPVLVIKGVY